MLHTQPYDYWWNEYNPSAHGECGGLSNATFNKVFKPVPASCWPGDVQGPITNLGDAVWAVSGCCAGGLWSCGAVPPSCMWPMGDWSRRGACAWEQRRALVSTAHHMEVHAPRLDVYGVAVHSCMTCVKPASSPAAPV